MSSWFGSRGFVQPWQTVAWVVLIAGWLIPFAYLLKRLTGRPPVRHAPLFVVSVFGLVAIFLEARTIISDPQGQRLGDRLAQTQVVEGAGAKDLVKSLQDWLLSLGDALGDAAGRRRRRRVPGGIDRAA